MACLGLLVLLAAALLGGTTFLALGAVAAAVVALALPVVLIAVAALVYAWRAIYPYLVRIGRWAADLRNSFPWAILMIVAMVFCFVVGLKLFFLLIIPGIIILLIFLFLLDLAVVVWIVRILRWLVPAVPRRFWATIHYVVLRFT